MTRYNRPHPAQQLIPYVASELGGPMFDGARTAYNMYQTAKPWVNRAAQSIKKGRKARRDRANAKRSLNKIGHTPGGGTSKRAQTGNKSFGAVSTCLLHSENITSIAKDTTDDALDRRERDQTVISGFKLCMEVQNSNASDGMYLNVAVVAPKDASGINNDDFFRAQSGNTRVANFDPAVLSANELHCFAINSDKYFVLKHKRMKLAQSDVNSLGKDRTNVDFYMKIGRQFAYDGIAQTPREDIFLVYWTSHFGRNPGTSAAGGDNDVTETFNRSVRMTTFFAEPELFRKKRRY